MTATKTKNARPSLEQAKAQYTNRFTMEHVPSWALQKRQDGTFYAPQFRSDAEWYENTSFPTNPRERFCTTINQSWPLGQALSQPYRKGA